MLHFCIFRNCYDIAKAFTYQSFHIVFLMILPAAARLCRTENQSGLYIPGSRESSSRPSAISSQAKTAAPSVRARERPLDIDSRVTGSSWTGLHLHFLITFLLCYDFHHGRLQLRFREGFRRESRVIIHVHGAEILNLLLK